MVEKKGSDFWITEIKKWSESGLNQSEYCRLNNLNLKRFYKWKIKFSEQEKLLTTDFFKIQVDKITESSEIEFVYREDFKFKLKSDFNPKLLKDVLEIIWGVKK